MHVHVDKSRRHNQSRGVELVTFQGLNAAAQFTDEAVFDRQIAHAVDILRGVHDSAILDNQLAHWARTLARTAMRTAMPFSTWLRIAERCESATSDEISRPRLMGPGCITM